MATDVLHFREVKISDEIRRDEALRQLVERVTELLLREIATSSAETVTLHWNRLSDSSIVLMLSDNDGAISRGFSVEELQHLDDWAVRSELRHLWGRLLQIRSHRQLQRLREVVRGLEDE